MNIAQKFDCDLFPNGRGAPAPIIIIGAGSAGLRAAITLAQHGVECVVLDENSSIGGAVARRPPALTSAAASGDRSPAAPTPHATKLFHEVERYSDQIHLRLGVQVLGSVTPGTMAVLCSGKVEQLAYSQLIVCTGCHERAQPFPGWTLPGVMSVGGVQLQLKAGLVRPGKSIVIAGTGPLLPVAARQLVEAGVNVRGVYESGRRVDLFRRPLDLALAPELLLEGIKCLAFLRRKGVPVKFGWGIVAARGHHTVQEAVVAPYDADWRPDRTREQTIETENLAVGYGFVSRSQICSQLGCAMEWHPVAGGDAPVRDEWMRTSVPSVYAGGDTAGVYGAYTASSEGHLAALGCLIESGVLTKDKAEAEAGAARRRLARLQRFRHAFGPFSGIRPGLLSLPAPDTTVCRCENVRLRDLDTAIARGAKSMIALKMATRVGMGDCQGKLCGPFCREYLANKTGQSIDTVGALRPRFPLAPVPFEALLAPTEESNA
jgi:hydrogen cyanide synthase HcnB